MTLAAEVLEGLTVLDADSHFTDVDDLGRSEHQRPIRIRYCTSRTSTESASGSSRGRRSGRPAAEAPSTETE